MAFSLPVRPFQTLHREPGPWFFAKGERSSKESNSFTSYKESFLSLLFLLSRLDEMLGQILPGSCVILPAKPSTEYQKE